MTPEQLELFLKDNRESTAKAIQITVNGKIDKIRERLDAHCEKQERDWDRIMPVVVAFETTNRALDDAKTSGKVILWVTGFITAVGGAWLVCRSIFFHY